MQTECYADAFECGYRSTRRFLLAQGVQIEDAEEIAQAAWARGWEYRNQVRDPKLVGYWVNSIARNLLRARYRCRETVSLDNINPYYAMDLDALEIDRLLDRCGTRDRAVLQLSLEGYTAEEIAERAGISPTGIRVRLMRARNTLKDQLGLAA